MITVAIYSMFAFLCWSLIRYWDCSAQAESEDYEKISREWKERIRNRTWQQGTWYKEYLDPKVELKNLKHNDDFHIGPGFLPIRYPRWADDEKIGE